MFSKWPLLVLQKFTKLLKPLLPSLKKFPDLVAANVYDLITLAKSFVLCTCFGDPVRPLFVTTQCIPKIKQSDALYNGTIC